MICPHGLPWATICLDCEAAKAEPETCDHGVSLLEECDRCDAAGNECHHGVDFDEICPSCEDEDASERTIQ